MSWRLTGDPPTQAIVVGTLPHLDGGGEEVTANPTNPTQLWLGNFPAAGVKRPTLDGKMRQETCVRIILPIRSPDAARP